MKILGILNSEILDACTAYRCVYPLNAMKMSGVETGFMTKEELADLVSKGEYPGADVILFQRLLSGTKDADFSLPYILRAAGYSTVVDYDDDYTNEYRKVHDGFLPDISGFSAVTVSTPFLKGRMNRLNRNVTVIPNYVPMEMFHGFKRVIPELTIGLTGSVTHKEDWKVVYEPIRAILEKYPHVRVFCSGHVPDELRGHGKVITIKDIDSSIRQDPDNLFIPLSQYGFILRQIDILLCPVSPADKFNWSKSALKAIEGQASSRAVGNDLGGCAVIASEDVPCYQPVIKNRNTGLFVKHFDEQAWFSSIEQLVINDALRHSIQVNGFQSCSKNFSLNKRYIEYVAAYSSFIRRDKKNSSKTLSKVADLLSKNPQLVSGQNPLLADGEIN